MKKNWKTTVTGVISVLPTVAHLIFPEVVTTEIAMGLSMLLVAAGFSVSKDHDATGGTRVIQ